MKIKLGPPRPPRPLKWYYRLQYVLQKCLIMSKFEEGERVLCFHGPLLYEARCHKVNTEGEVTLICFCKMEAMTYYKYWFTKSHVFCLDRYYITLTRNNLNVFNGRHAAMIWSIYLLLLSLYHKIIINKFTDCYITKI